MRCLDGIINPMDLSLRKLRERVKEPGMLQFMELQRGGHELATEQQLPSAVTIALLDLYQEVLLLGNENSFQGLYSELF